LAPRKTRVAIAYDFDGTLAPGNMQEHAFIPDIGMKSADFWAEVKKITKENNGDEVLVYMSLMLEKARSANVKVDKSSLADKGRNLKLFNGVDDWFERINSFADSKNILVEHYLISSGNEEIVLGTSIGRKFKKIYASKFRYDANGVPIWPVLAVNYTNKTQYLFRINKGALDPSDKNGVNQFIDKKDRPVPFENMIFIGDGETDIPCFRLVKDQGGLSIAVYSPDRRKPSLTKKLLEEGRVHSAVVANYAEGESLEKIVFAKIEEVSARVSLEKTMK
jgi:phosphoserine phosphatase